MCLVYGGHHISGLFLQLSVSSIYYLLAVVFHRIVSALLMSNSMAHELNCESRLHMK